MPPKIERVNTPKQPLKIGGEGNVDLKFPGHASAKFDTGFTQRARFREPSHAAREAGVAVTEQPAVHTTSVGHEPQQKAESSEEITSLGDMTITSLAQESSPKLDASQRTGCMTQWCPSCANCSHGRKC